MQELVGNEDERQTIIRERGRAEEKLRRLKQMYKDLIVSDDEYRAALNELQARLKTLVLPDSPQLIEAGEFLESLKALWEAATLAEQRDITRLLLKNVHVYVPSGELVAIEPNPAFRLLFTEICQDIGVKVL